MFLINMYINSTPRLSGYHNEGGEKMKLFKQLIFIFLLVFAADCHAQILYPVSKITIKAVDDAGNPIENASVTASYDYPKGFGMGWGTSTKFVDAKTDKDGFYTITKGAAGRCNFRVSKEGYYDTSKSYIFKEKTLLFVWSPWNPVMEIKLKRIINPTPMYAKNTTPLKIPLVENPVGYDFEKGDWVAPYGKGIISDIVFTFNVRFVKNDDWDVSYKLTFTNEKDGIQEYINPNDYGVYRWPYEAPEDGYRKEFSAFAANYREGWGSKHKSSFNKERKFIFRVRTQTDEKGNIIKANYGKLSGDPQFDYGYIKFTYYFNPTGSRSLEFGGNLFKFSRKEWEYKVSGP